MLVGMDLGSGSKTIPVFGLFAEGSELTDAYSGVKGRVSQGKVSIVSSAGLVLLSR